MLLGDSFLSGTFSLPTAIGGAGGRPNGIFRSAPITWKGKEEECLRCTNTIDMSQRLFRYDFYCSDLKKVSLREMRIATWYKYEYQVFFYPVWPSHGTKPTPTPVFFRHSPPLFPLWNPPPFPFPPSKRSSADGAVGAHPSERPSVDLSEAEEEGGERIYVVGGGGENIIQEFYTRRDNSET